MTDKERLAKLRGLLARRAISELDLLDAIDTRPVRKRCLRCDEEYANAQACPHCETVGPDGKADRCEEFTLLMTDADALAIEQLEAFIQGNFPKLFETPLPARFAVMAFPGQGPKIEAMRCRLERGEQIFHPADLTQDRFKQGDRVLTRGRNGQVIPLRIGDGMQLPFCPTCRQDFAAWKRHKQRQHLCRECEPVVAWRSRHEQPEEERRAAA